MNALRGLLLGSGGPTEARRSIRASLGIFGQIEDYLEFAAKNNSIGSESEISSYSRHRRKLLSQKQPSHLLFERLVAQNANTPNRLSMTAMSSCGHTSQCFASLFFSKEQIESNSMILAHTNGTDIVQLWENWNIVWYGIQKRWATSSSSFCSLLVTNILRLRAVHKAGTLSESLLRIDPPKDLPRVVFCNLTWVLCQQIKTDSPPESMLELRKQTTSPDDDHDDDDDGSIDALKHVKDHQWCIIKHDNDRFQVVQGYIGSVHGNHSNQRGWCAEEVRSGTDVVRTASTSTNDNVVVEGGYCLSDWQHQLSKGDRHLVHGGRFSSRHGFSCMEMEGFLCKILTFATSPSFDAASYKCLFGVFHPESDKVQVWSSVSFRELEDASIDGYGDRFVANEIARKLPNLFTSHQRPLSCEKECLTEQYTP
jgi:hypothetical protein